MISQEEYLANERGSETKSEYYQGEIFAMAGAAERHNLIETNVIGELRSQLKKYVMISRNTLSMEKYTKDETHSWIFTKTDDAYTTIFLESIGCELALAEVYDKTKSKFLSTIFNLF